MACRDCVPRRGVKRRADGARPLGPALLFLRSTPRTARCPMRMHYGIVLVAIATVPPASTASLIDDLRSDLKSSNVETRRAAVLKVGWLGPEAAAALPELRQTARDPDIVVRHDTFNTLARIGPKAVPVLTDTLVDSNTEVRWRAITTIMRMGASAKDAVPALGDRVRNAAGLRMRILAAMALGQLGPDAKSALPELIAAAKDPGADTTWYSDHPSSVCEAAIGAVRK